MWHFANMPTTSGKTKNKTCEKVLFFISRATAIRHVFFVPYVKITDKFDIKPLCVDKQRAKVACNHLPLYFLRVASPPRMYLSAQFSPNTRETRQYSFLSKRGSLSLKSL